MMPREITHYRFGVQSLYLHDWAEGTDLYKTAGRTPNVEEAVEHDGPVLVKPTLGTWSFYRLERDEYETIQGYHPYAGRMKSFDPESAYDIILLKRVALACEVCGGAINGDAGLTSDSHPEGPNNIACAGCNA